MTSFEVLTPSELYQERYKLLRQMSKLEEELNKRRDQDRHIMRAQEQEWKEVSETAGLKIQGPPVLHTQLVSPELGFNIHNSNAFLLEIPLGSQGGAYHMHGEAIKYYLEGEGEEIIGDKRYSVKQGDTAFIPASVWHGTQNTRSKPLRIFAVSHSEVGVPIMEQAIIATRQS
jgi:mannose-6-phosphate isomerase-like protein (cupin superfamily)